MSPSASWLVGVTPNEHKSSKGARFCVVQRKTHVLSGTLTPHFDELFEWKLPAVELLKRKLIVSLCEEGTLTNDILGEVRMPWRRQPAANRIAGSAFGGAVLLLCCMCRCRSTCARWPTAARSGTTGTPCIEKPAAVSASKADDEKTTVYFTAVTTMLLSRAIAKLYRYVTLHSSWVRLLRLAGAKAQAVDVEVQAELMDH